MAEECGGVSTRRLAFSAAEEDPRTGSSPPSQPSPSAISRATFAESPAILTVRIAWGLLGSCVSRLIDAPVSLWMKFFVIPLRPMTPAATAEGTLSVTTWLPKASKFIEVGAIVGGATLDAAPLPGGGIGGRAADMPGLGPLS